MSDTRKATIEFSLPEDEKEFIRAVFADQMWGTIIDLDTEMRNMLKYGNSTFASPACLAHHVRDRLQEVITRIEE